MTPGELWTCRRCGRRFANTNQWDSCIELALGEHFAAHTAKSVDGTGCTEPGECHVSDTVENVHVGCFPDLYAAPAGNKPDHIITL